MRLITVAETKTLLAQTTSNFDALIGLLVDSYSVAFEKYLNRKLKKEERVQRFMGGGLQYQLPAYPVDPEAELLVSEDSSTLDLNEDYFIDYESGLIDFDRRITQRTSRPLEITWTGGFPAAGSQEDGKDVLVVNDTIKAAIYMQVNYVFRRRDKLGLEAVNLGDMGSMTVQGHMGLIPEVRQILSGERRLPSFL